MACVCGSDLWYYRGESDHAVGSIGHEFIGVVEDVGRDVTGVDRGDLVVAPFISSDLTCPHCRHGSTIWCVSGGTFGDGTIDGGQGEAVRVPLAGSTLVPVPGTGHSDATLKSLLTLSDVMSTGHHAARSASPGSSAPPTSSSSGAKRPPRRSSTSPAASASTPHWSASARPSRSRPPRPSLVPAR
jgi:threonine dehydrogenase-like Zn-dependent dehydrogenase